MSRDPRSRGWLDEHLERWLDDGPAPSDALITRTLDAVATTRQRRSPSWPWAVLSATTFGATALAAAFVAVAFLALVVPSRLPVPGGEPRAMPTLKPAWDTRFPVITAGDFPAGAFTYAIDPASGLILTSWPDPYQFRVPRGPDPNNFDEGVIVHSTGGGLRGDACRADGGAVDSNPTPQRVITAIQSLAGLVVSAPESTTVDGRPALAVTLSGTENRTCDAYYLFDGFEPPFAWSGSEGRTRRIIVVEVGQDVVVIEVTASDARYVAWLPTAEAFIDSIHFLP